MSVAQETPVTTREARQVRPPRRNGRWSGYRHLLEARMLELKREPEVVFWVFVFPLLLALGLGIAFRDKPPDVTSIAIVAGANSQRLVSLLQQSPEHGVIHADVLEESTALDQFRLGKYALVVSMDAQVLHYRYDPARPESVLAR